MHTRGVGLTTRWHGEPAAPPPPPRAYLAEGEGVEDVCLAAAVLSDEAKAVPHAELQRGVVQHTLPRDGDGELVDLQILRPGCRGALVDILKNQRL